MSEYYVSTIMTIEDACCHHAVAMLCGGLCLEEVRHTNVKVAQCSVWFSSERGTGDRDEVCYL